MAKFAGMILDEINKIQAPSPAHGAPPHVSQPAAGHESTAAKKKSAPKRYGRKLSKRRHHSSSSSESSGEERRKRSPRKMTSPTPPPAGATFNCYGCGAPGVIHRNCAKCTPESVADEVSGVTTSSAEDVAVILDDKVDCYLGANFV